MRCLGAKEMPNWLIMSLGHYPSTQDYEIASDKECDAYWNQSSTKETEDDAEMSSNSFNNDISLDSIEMDGTYIIKVTNQQLSKPTLAPPQ